jgi:penicillin-binding protein 1A
MVDAGYLGADAARQAKAAPATPRALAAAGELRYFTNWVLDRLPDYVGPTQRNLLVTTTLDPRLQALAEKTLKQTLKREGARRAVGQGAFLAMDRNGGIKAMVGGRSYRESQFNRTTQARRQPGSAFKLFVYLAAFERGMTPDTVMRDSPVVFGDWQPRNYKRQFVGDVTLRDAFANSINTVAVKVSERAGRSRVIRTAERLGIVSPMPPHPSLALGTAGISLLELTSAYVVIANGGFGVLPHGITRVQDGDGNVLYDRTGSGPGRLVPARHVDWMTGLLEATITQGTGKAARLDRPAAGKTGTSQDFRDAWFVGFSGGLTAGVWFGNDDGSPMKKVTGGGLPARTWRHFMTEIKTQPGPEQTRPTRKRGFLWRLFGLDD